MALITKVFLVLVFIVAEITATNLLGQTNGIAIINKIVKAKTDITKATEPIIDRQLIEVVVGNAIASIFPIGFTTGFPPC